MIQNTAELKLHAMDVLAAFRVAALQARRDGMPLCAKRHEDDAEALDQLLRECGHDQVTITFI